MDLDPAPPDSTSLKTKEYRSTTRDLYFYALVYLVDLASRVRTRPNAAQCCRRADDRDLADAERGITEHDPIETNPVSHEAPISPDPSNDRTGWPIKR